MENPITARPLSGRWIALDVRPARPLTLLGPAWATLCGALASGGVSGRGQSILFLLLAIFLSDALLSAWRALWLESDWRAALQRLSSSAPIWLESSPDAPRSALARLRERVARHFAYWRQVVLPTLASEVFGLGIAGALALSIAIVLGQPVVALTALAMICALIEGEMPSARGAGLRALFEIMLPWLIGQAVFGNFSWLALFFGVLVTLVYRALLGLAATRQARWFVWSNLAQLTIVLALVVVNAPIPAGVAALALLAQILWQARYHLDRDGVAYAQRAQSYLMVTMLMSALAVWL